MSLLLNNIILNTKTSTNFKKEETSYEEIKTFLHSSKIKQTRIDNKISILNLLEKGKNTIKSLIKIFAKKYLNFLKRVKKKKNTHYIKYVIHVSILKKNTTIYVTDTKGRLKLFCSASFSLKLSGKQKTMQPKVLIGLLKYFLKKAYFLKSKSYKEVIPVALHSKYISKRFLKLIMRRLKRKFKVKIINYYNFHPHNGCRLKKIRRLKRRKRNKRTKKRFFFYNKTKKLWKFVIRQHRHKDT